MKKWDKEAVYDAQVAPLMEQILEICKREGIPAIASFAYLRDAAGITSAATSFVPGCEEFARALDVIRS